MITPPQAESEKTSRSACILGANTGSHMVRRHGSVASHPDRLLKTSQSIRSRAFWPPTWSRTTGQITEVIGAIQNIVRETQ
eukprot:8890183-Pyramimonas_sp.AAC.1